MNWLKSCRLVAAFFIAILTTTTLSAQVPDRNAIPNWPAPATWSPSAAGGGLQTMTDISFAIPFVAVAPCRVADTRGLGFSGQAGPPALNTGPRTFQITGTVAGVPSQCGIPTGADAVSFQFTIVSPNTAGNLIAWPAGGSAPTISVLNWSAGETALGNGTIVPLSAAGAISVQINAAVGGATGHLVLDVNGYFSDDLPSGQHFEVAGSRVGAVLRPRTPRPGRAPTRSKVCSQMRRARPRHPRQSAERSPAPAATDMALSASTATASQWPDSPRTGLPCTE